MEREEFIDLVSKLPKYKKNVLTDEFIGIETAKKLADLIDEWDDYTYETMYKKVMIERGL